MGSGHFRRIAFFSGLLPLLFVSVAFSQGVIVEGTLGTSGTGPGEFHAPKGVWNAGALWVVDSGNDRIQLVREPFAFEDVDGDPGYSVIGSSGTGPGEFRNPTAVAGEWNRPEIFVTDTGNDRIQVFDRTGNWLRSFGETGSGPGQLRGPAWIAVYGGDVYVTDAGNHRVQVFDAEGNFLRQWGSEGDGPGQFRDPSGISAWSEEGVLVADAQLGTVQRFAADGTYEGEYASGLDQPRGISEDGFQIAVSGSNRIWVGGVGTDYSAVSRGFGPLSGPQQAAGYCCYWGVVTDTGNDRLLILVGTDPVEAATWGTLKRRYGK